MMPPHPAPKASSILGGSGGEGQAAGAPTHSDDDDDDKGRPPCPLEHCPWWSVLTFVWLNPLIRLGGKRVLEEGDLPRLARTERAGRLQDLVLVRVLGWGSVEIMRLPLSFVTHTH